MFFVLRALLTRFVHGGGGAGRALLGEREKRGRLLTRAFDVLSVSRFPSVSRYGGGLFVPVGGAMRIPEEDPKEYGEEGDVLITGLLKSDVYNMLDNNSVIGFAESNPPRRRWLKHW